MKRIEDRLREKAKRTERAEWLYLDDALAIVAEYHSESTEITGTYPELRDPTKGESYDLVIKDGSISSAPGTISFGSENLRYHRDIDAGEAQIPMRDQVLMWLGYWRDHIPPKAVSALQDICGIPTNSPSEGKG